MKNKYNAKKCYEGNIKFDSMKEKARFLILSAQQEMGLIYNLKLQPRFDFKIDNKLMFFYKADFSYYNDKNEYIIEDVKSSYTAKLPLFRLKKKIIEATYKIKIIEVY